MPKNPVPASTLRERAHARAGVLDTQFRAAITALSDLSTALDDTVDYDLHRTNLAQEVADVIVATAEPRYDRDGRELPTLGAESAEDLRLLARIVANQLNSLIEHADGGRYGLEAA